MNNSHSSTTSYSSTKVFRNTVNIIVLWEIKNNNYEIRRAKYQRMPTIRNSSKAIGMASLLRPSGEVQSWDHRYEGWIRFHVLRKWVEAVFFFLKGVVTRSQKVPLYSWEHTKPFLHKEKYFPLFRSDMCGTPLVPGFPFHWDSYVS